MTTAPAPPAAGSRSVQSDLLIARMDEHRGPHVHVHAGGDGVTITPTARPVEIQRGGGIALDLAALAEYAKAKTPPKSPPAPPRQGAGAQHRRWAKTPKPMGQPIADHRIPLEHQVHAQERRAQRHQDTHDRQDKQRWNGICPRITSIIRHPRNSRPAARR